MVQAELYKHFHTAREISVAYIVYQMNTFPRASFWSKTSPLVAYNINTNLK